MEDEGLAVRRNRHPLIAGRLFVIHIPPDPGGVGDVGVAEGGHGIPILHRGSGVGRDAGVVFPLCVKRGRLALGSASPSPALSPRRGGGAGLGYVGEKARVVKSGWGVWGLGRRVPLKLRGTEKEEVGTRRPRWGRLPGPIILCAEPLLWHPLPSWPVLGISMWPESCF